MDLVDSPFFSTLRARLHQLGQRQELVAENIANASTPGFTPRDVDTKAFDAVLSQMAGKAGAGGALPMARTAPGHLPSAAGPSAPIKTVAAPDSETTIDGNQVVLEDQMLKAAETRAGFETSLALYQKGLSLLSLAIKSPTR